MKKTAHSFSRRRLLDGALGLGAAAATPGLWPANGDAEPTKPRFLLNVCASGGASIIDSFLAIAHSETSKWKSINAFPESEVKRFDGSPFRAVDLTRTSSGAYPFPLATNQSNFVQAHRDNMVVATVQNTSVNHFVGQRRSVTGNEAWKGRTLSECVALAHGNGFPLPNVNMASGGFSERGLDETLPEACYAESIALPASWSLGLDARQGIRGAPSASLIERARALRENVVEPASPFLQAFARAPALQRWAAQRVDARTKLESAGLLEKLCLLRNSKEYSLSEYGLKESPEAALLREAFPSMDTDPFEAQAALTYLLFKNRVSVTSSIWPSNQLLLDVPGMRLVNAALSFDASHGTHRDMQALMWGRILSVIDRLIRLLRQVPFDDASGESLWDRTLIYVATEFGRTKDRVDGQLDFGSSHDLNNGALLISPMLKGNRVLGGVNPDTGLTYGFNLQTGAPDPGRLTSEPELFAGILDALRVDTSGSGLPSVVALRG
jgi:hypothetical protein